MIVDSKPNTLSHHTNAVVAPFLVKRKNMSQLMSILRDQLYSNKKLAPIREYSCNAYDANVEAGKKTTPIMVTLPNSLIPTLKIRDNGKGLSYYDIINIYCSYGESTKTNSNEMVGHLGIGSKSAFAYGDSFIVTSFFEGTRTVYSCALDESSAGSVIVMDSGETDEESGIEIAITVKDEDVSEFIATAIQFFKYWDVKPIIYGMSPILENEYNSIEKPILFSEQYNVYTKGYSYDNSYVVMGNIRYPLDLGILRSLVQNDSVLSTIYNYVFDRHKVVIKANIGDVEHSPSRESLQYTNRTLSFISSIISKIKDDLLNSINSEINKCANLWDAKILYGKLFKYTIGDEYRDNVYSNLEKVYIGLVKYKDVVIRDAKFSKVTPIKNTNEFSTPVMLTFFRKKKRVQVKNTTDSGYDNIVCDSQYKIIICDGELPSNYNVIVRYYMNEHKDALRVYVLNFLSDEVKTEFYNNNHFEGVPYTSFDVLKNEYIENKRIQKEERAKNRVSGIVVKSPKRADIVVYNTGTAHDGTTQKVDLGAESGVYMTSQRSKVEFRGEYHTEYTVSYNLIHAFKTLSLPLPKIFVGPKAMLSKFMMHRDRIKDVKTEIPNIISKYADILENYCLYTFFSSVSLPEVMIATIKSGVTDPNSVYSEMYDLIAKYKAIRHTNAGDAYAKLDTYFRTELSLFIKPQCEKYKSLLVSFYKKYPMLSFVKYSPYEEQATNIVSYINSMDSH